MGEPLNMTGTWAQVEGDKGGATGRKKAVIGMHEKLLGTPGMVGKFIRAMEANGLGRHTGERSLCTRARWGETSRCKDRDRSGINGLNMGKQ